MVGRVISQAFQYRAPLFRSELEYPKFVNISPNHRVGPIMDTTRKKKKEAFASHLKLLILNFSGA